MSYGVRGPRRRDARRNRLAIIQAAADLMSDPGSPGLMPEVARRAGVGQATLYRHFPDRNALADAVIASEVSRLEACAGGLSRPEARDGGPSREACDNGPPREVRADGPSREVRADGPSREACADGSGPRVVFRDLLREVLHAQVRMRSLVTLAHRMDAGTRDRYERRIVAALSEPLRRAQERREVRGDFHARDLALLFGMVEGILNGGGDVATAQAAAHRSIELILDGLFLGGGNGRLLETNVRASP